MLFCCSFLFFCVESRDTDNWSWNSTIWLQFLVLHLLILWLWVNDFIFLCVFPIVKWFDSLIQLKWLMWGLSRYSIDTLACSSHLRSVSCCHEISCSCYPVLWKEHWINRSGDTGPGLGFHFYIVAGTWERHLIPSHRKQVVVAPTSSFCKWNCTSRDEEAHPKSPMSRPGSASIHSWFLAQSSSHHYFGDRRPCQPSPTLLKTWGLWGW